MNTNLSITTMTRTKPTALSMHAIFLLLFLFFSVGEKAHGAVTVSTISQISNAISAANSGGDKTILIQPGTYNLNGVYFRISEDGVTVKGNGTKRGDVILDGAYITTEIFQVVGSNIHIQNLTVKRAYYHPIHVIGSASKSITGTVIDNVHVIDPGQQAIKINPSGDRIYSVNDGIVKNTLIELTASGRKKVWDINGSCYTGGVDAHFAKNWIIQDNRINGFWCENGLSEHGIHFWSNSSETLVERNLITDCDRGIGFGLGSSAHLGGIIRNNMIYHGANHGHSDVGIGLESASNTSVYNNTIFHEHPYPYAIEYRFAAATNNYIANNLTNKQITSRNSGQATLVNNVTSANASWFVNPSQGNLHLASDTPGVTDSGVDISGLTDDFDKQLRPYANGIDIGADEHGLPSGPGTPGTPSGLHVVPTTQLLLLK